VAAVGTADARAESLGGPASANATGVTSVLTSATTTPAPVKVPEAIIDHATAGGTIFGAGVSDSRVAFAQPAPDPSLALPAQSASFLTALPLDADVVARLASNPKVHEHLNVAGEGGGPASTVLGLLTLRGSRPSAAAGSSADGTTHATGAESVRLDPLPNRAQHLFVGLLDPTAQGGGFDTLNFQVTREGAAVIDQSFTDLASALAWFDDHPLDLGATGAGVQGPLDLTFRLTMTGGAGEGFTADLLFANATEGAGPAAPVPEPGGALAVLGTLAGGAMLRRARRRHG
jgi:hypothetical protein